MRFRRFRWRTTTRRLQAAVNVEDLRSLARRHLPRGVFDYVDGAAEDELSAAENMRAFRDIRLHPRVLRDVSRVETTTSILGQPAAFPLVLSPTGFTRIVHPDGELAVARAARRADIPYAVSTLSTRSMEEVASVGGRLWFQVYPWRDRGLMRELLSRASAAAYGAIVITVDLPVHGHRERDVRRGFELPPTIGLQTVVEALVHPRWTFRFLRSDPIRFANLLGVGGRDGSDPVRLADFVSGQFDPSLSWSDLEWFRSAWDGPIVLKGIQTVDDARIAVEHQIEGIALSNHGGRQLDGSPAPITLLPEVADSVGGSLEIYCDGGIRRGSDIAKAVALGATACMIGRPYLYGLGAAGEAGVDQVILQLREGFSRTMALSGLRTVSEVDARLVGGSA